MYDPSLLLTNSEIEGSDLFVELTSRFSFDWLETTGLEKESISFTTISLLISIGTLGAYFTTPEMEVLTSPAAMSMHLKF